MTTYRARHLPVGIECPFGRTHEFLSDPANFPAWAAGLGNKFEHVKGMEWRAASPMGPVSIRFSEPNGQGVLDHWVTLPDGETVHNPMRVMPNGAGAEVVFTLFQRPGMDDAEFERDAAAVEQDLRTLKTLLEKRP